MTEDGELELFDFPDRDTDWNFITGLQVSDGRVTIRKGERGRHGIEEQAEYDVVVRTESGERIFIPEAKVADQYRVRIPHRRRERYGIEDGDYVDMAIRPA